MQQQNHERDIAKLEEPSTSATKNARVSASTLKDAAAKPRLSEAINKLFGTDGSCQGCPQKSIIKEVAWQFRSIPQKRKCDV